MSARRAVSAPLGFALAALLCPLAWLADAGAAGASPVTVHVDRPLYAASEQGLRHFVDDELSRLVVGQSWTWRGHDFEVVRMHTVLTSKTTRDREPNRDYASPVRGWVVAIIHVKVDGQIRRARVTANADYEWQPAGWRWSEVLLHLEGADSYDFVKRKVV